MEPPIKGAPVRAGRMGNHQKGPPVVTNQKKAMQEPLREVTGHLKAGNLTGKQKVPTLRGHHTGAKGMRNLPHRGNAMKHPARPGKDALQRTNRKGIVLIKAGGQLKAGRKAPINQGHTKEAGMINHPDHGNVMKIQVLRAKNDMPAANHRMTVHIKAADHRETPRREKIRRGPTGATVKRNRHGPGNVMKNPEPPGKGDIRISHRAIAHIKAAGQPMILREVPIHHAPIREAGMRSLNGHGSAAMNPEHRAKGVFLRISQPVTGHTRAESLQMIKRRKPDHPAHTEATGRIRQPDHMQANFLKELLLNPGPG